MKPFSKLFWYSENIIHNEFYFCDVYIYLILVFFYPLGLFEILLFRKDIQGLYYLLIVPIFSLALKLIVLLNFWMYFIYDPMYVLSTKVMFSKLMYADEDIYYPLRWLLVSIRYG